MGYYGNLILRERLARSWSQAGLCKDICTVSYLSKIETGKAQPSADVLRLLLARLGLHTDPALEAAGARCAEDGYERLFTGRVGELAAVLPAVSDETYRATAAWTDLLLLRQFDRCLLQLELGAVFFTQNKAGEQNQRGRRNPRQIQPHAELQYALFFQLFIISKTRSRARK